MPVLSFQQGLDYGSIEITEDHFGTVATAQFMVDSNGQGDPTIGSAFDKSIDALGVTCIRFPGGTEAWQSFEWRREDDPKFSQEMPFSLEQLHAMIDYCSVKGIGLSFTLPIREFENSSDVRASETEIARFLKEDLLDYAGEKGVAIDSIKIGNEAGVGSGGGQTQSGMDAVQIGDVSSELTQIVGETLDKYFEATDNSMERPLVYIEPGHLWQNGFADVNANGLQDIQDVLYQFDEVEAQFVDMIDVHAGNLDMSYERFFGYGFEDAAPGWLTHDAWLDLMLDHVYLFTAGNAGFDGVGHGTLAWAYENGNDEGASLANSAIAFLQFAEMSENNIEQAFQWMGSGWSSNAAFFPGFSGENSSYTKAGGAITALMRDALPGKSSVYLEHDPTMEEEVAIRMFAGGGEAVIYIANLTNETDKFSFDLMEAVSSAELGEMTSLEIKATLLSVEGDPEDHKSRAFLEEFDEDDILSGGTVSIELGPHQIVQISIDLPKPHTQPIDDLGLLTEGDDGDNTIKGSDGNDLLFGNAGKDNLAAGDGNDILYGGDGKDLMGGGFGDDFIFGGQGFDVIGGGPGADEIFSGKGFDVVSGGWGPDIIFSGEGHDTVAGSFGHDLLYSGDGSDSVGGGNGNDIIFAGNGGDNVGAGFGDDVVQGEDGADFLAGGDGDDTLFGGSDNDRLNSGDGNDLLFGGEGFDTFVFRRSEEENFDTISDFSVDEDVLQFIGYLEQAKDISIETFNEDQDNNYAVVTIGSQTIRVLSDTEIQAEDIQIIFG